MEIILLFENNIEFKKDFQGNFKNLGDQKHVEHLNIVKFYRQLFDDKNSERKNK